MYTFGCWRCSWLFPRLLASRGLRRTIEVTSSRSQFVSHWRLDAIRSVAGKTSPASEPGGCSAPHRDARLYISAAAFIDAAGREVPIELDQNDWQYANVALLDFEGKTGRCVGDVDTCDTIKGVAPKARYRGLRNGS